MPVNNSIIEGLIRQFETHQLPAGEWTHEAHLMVAIWNVLYTPSHRLVNKLRDDIRQYNEATGTPNTDHGGYHETITVFWLKVLRQFIASGKFNDAAATFEALRHSDLSERSLLFEFYSRERLFSVEARRSWMPPDLLTSGHIRGRIESSQKSHYAVSDAKLEAGLLDGSFDPSRFSHEAHLRVAFISLSCNDDTAEDNVCRIIETYVAHLGAQSKFNKTLTIAAVKTVRHFMRRSKTRSFYELMIEFPKLKFHFRDLIDAHYGFDIFKSEEAKREFVEPDLQPYT